MFKKLRYFFETIIVKLGFALFFVIGVKNASNFGSFLARMVGKRMPVNKLARSNISKALPDLSDDEVDGIIDGMWDNLGRISGEFIHCCKLDQKEIGRYVGADKETIRNLDYIKKNGKGGIIFSAHIGNWEVGPKFFMENGLDVKSVYRPLNNEAVEEITSRIRKISLIPKNAKGNKQIIREIKNGNYVIILVDQKNSEGIEVPFFHDKALTTSSIARLALRYDIPLIPARVIRVGKAFKFKMEVGELIEVDKDNSKDVDGKIYDLTLKVNQKLESWIREYPAQWFWVHNRWKK